MNVNFSQMNIFPSAEDATRKFYLWCNEKKHEYPADTFARVSKKCAALVKSNDYQGSIGHPVSDETFEAFSAACKLEPFKVTLNNAFELLELAQEWGIPSLETFVVNYIDSKGIKRRDIGDPLGDLLLHIEEETEDRSLIRDFDHINLILRDIEGVAHMFNQYLTDERLSRVHPEILFKIMIQAEQFHINQQLLIDFVMKLFENEPDKAVTLCLRIDFDLLTESQLEEIFQCREIHEQAMGYFICASMSALRNKAKYDLDDMEQRYLKDMQEIRETILESRTTVLAELQQNFEDEMQGLEDLHEKQQKQIEELKAVRDEQQQMLNDEDDRFDTEMKKLEGELARQQEIMDQRQRQIDDRHQKIEEQVRLKGAPIIEETKKRIDEIIANDTKRRNDLVASVKPLLDNIVKIQEFERNRITEINKSIEVMHNKNTAAFSSIAAKISSDQFKYNAFLRNVENRLAIFKDEPKLWDLNYEDVEEADRIVSNLEAKLKNICPLNVNHTIKASTDAFGKFADALTRKKQSA